MTAEIPLLFSCFSVAEGRVVWVTGLLDCVLAVGFCGFVIIVLAELFPSKFSVVTKNDLRFCMIVSSSCIVFMKHVF